MRVLRQIWARSGLGQFSLLNPLVIALLPSLILVSFNPFKSFRYEVTNDNVSPRKEGVHFYGAVDLEGDQNEEIVRVADDPADISYVSFYNEELQIEEQVNLAKRIFEFRSREQLLFADVDSDSVQEVLVFTSSSDSLFLNILSYPELDLVMTDVFVSRLGGFNEFQDASLVPIGSFDRNGDGLDEVYFAISAGFSLYPRRVFCFDPGNNTLTRSANTGAVLYYGHLFFEPDTLLLLAGLGYGNTDPGYPYPYLDTASWVFGFDPELNASFDPVYLDSYISNLVGFVQTTKGFVFISKQDNLSNGLIMEMDHKGRVLRSKQVGTLYSQWNFCRLRGREVLILYDPVSSERYGFDLDDFQIVESNKVEELKNTNYLGSIDIGHDQKPESVYYFHKERKLKLFSETLKLILEVEDISLPEGVEHISLKHLENEWILMLSSEDSLIRLFFRHNQLHQAVYLYYLLAYLGFASFLAFLAYMQDLRFERKRATEQQIANLQLQNLRNQLDPHFTFNALNSVGKAVLLEDREKTYDLFQRFSRLIRSSLLVTDKIFRPLSEELIFTGDYLEFQQTRFKGRFEYLLSYDEKEIEGVSIPKMLVQAYAENAVKHAFYGVDYKGLIRIIVRKMDEHTQISIEDNGIGMRRSRELAATSGTRIGGSNLEKQVELINKLGDQKIQVQITDREQEEGHGQGTRIRIRI